MTANSYSVHPAIAYTQAILSNLQQKTGRTLEEWITHVTLQGPEGEKAIREWLRGEGLEAACSPPEASPGRTESPIA